MASDDELDIQMTSKPRVNPFASKRDNQEIQASKLSQMRRNKLNQQKKQTGNRTGTQTGQAPHQVNRMQKLQLQLEDDSGEQMSTAQLPTIESKGKQSMSTILETLDSADNAAHTPAVSSSMPSSLDGRAKMQPAVKHNNFVLDLEDSNADPNTNEVIKDPASQYDEDQNEQAQEQTVAKSGKRIIKKAPGFSNQS